MLARKKSSRYINTKFIDAVSREALRYICVTAEA